MKLSLVLLALLLISSVGAVTTKEEHYRGGNCSALWCAGIKVEANITHARLWFNGSTTFGTTVERDYFIDCANATVQPVFDHNKGWSGANRCSGTSVMERVPVCPAFNVSGSTTDNNVGTFVGADDNNMWNSQPIAKCSNNTAAGIQFIFSDFEVSNSTKNGSRIYGDHGGSFVGSSGGNIMPDEICPGQHINHTFKINVYGRPFLNFTNTSSGFRCGTWPATTCDTNYQVFSASGYYGGSNQNVTMGSLLTVKDFDTFRTVNATLKNESSRIFWEAFYLYGAVIVDNTAWDPYAVAFGKGAYLDPNNNSVYYDAEATFQECNGYAFDIRPISGGESMHSDWNIMITNLSVVVNNTPSSPGGGKGTPRSVAYYAPPSLAGPNYNESTTPVNNSYTGFGVDDFRAEVNSTGWDYSSVDHVIFQVQINGSWQNWTIDNKHHKLILHGDDGNNTARYGGAVRFNNTNWNSPNSGFFGGGYNISSLVNTGNVGLQGINASPTFLSPTTQNGENYLCGFYWQAQPNANTTNPGILSITSGGTFSPSVTYIANFRKIRTTWSTHQSNITNFPNGTTMSKVWVGVLKNTSAPGTNHRGISLLNGTVQNLTEGVVVPNAPSSSPLERVWFSASVNESFDELHCWNESKLPGQIIWKWEYDRLWINFTNTGINDSYVNYTFLVNYTNRTSQTLVQRVINFGPQPPTDTCSCPGSGNWVMQCSDQCKLQTACSMPSNNMSLKAGTGNGTLFLNSTIVLDNKFQDTGCIIQYGSAGKIEYR